MADPANVDVGVVSPKRIRSDSPGTGHLQSNSDYKIAQVTMMVAVGAFAGHAQGRVGEMLALFE